MIKNCERFGKEAIGSGVDWLFAGFPGNQDRETHSSAGKLPGNSVNNLSRPEIDLMLQRLTDRKFPYQVIPDHCSSRPGRDQENTEKSFPVESRESLIMIRMRLDNSRDVVADRGLRVARNRIS
jgi:hypothetical protein